MWFSKVVGFQIVPFYEMSNVLVHSPYNKSLNSFVWKSSRDPKFEMAGLMVFCVRTQQWLQELFVFSGNFRGCLFGKSAIGLERILFKMLVKRKASISALAVSIC